MYFKVFASVVLFSLIQSYALNCEFEAADGIHYNLAPLMKNDGDYRVYDYLQVTGNKTYTLSCFSLFL